jgi:hypothetical protein
MLGFQEANACLFATVVTVALSVTFRRALRRQEARKRERQAIRALRARQAAHDLNALREQLARDSAHITLPYPGKRAGAAGHAASTSRLTIKG